MPFLTDFSTSVTSHIRALSFIAKHNLWLYFLVPVCITVVLCIFGLYSLNSIGETWNDDIRNKLSNYIPHDGIFGTILGYLVYIVSFIVGTLAKWIAAFFFLKILRYIVLILCSPVMASLSERVDEILTGKKYPFVLSKFLHDILRGILVSLRNMFFETLITLPLLLILWIPLIGWIPYAFLAIIGWYFLGFNMMDYTYERRGLRVSQGAHLTRKHKGIAIGNGMVYSFLLWIPIFGIAFAPILSSLAATLATVEVLEKK